MGVYDIIIYPSTPIDGDGWGDGGDIVECVGNGYMLVSTSL